MEDRTSRLAALDKAHLWHPFTQMRDWTAPGHEPLILTGGRGVILRDSRGREYIDGNSSIWTNIHGHGHPVLVEAIRRQLDQVAHVSFLGSSNEPAILLGERLVGLLPDSGLTRVFYSDDGSTAIEVALKMTLQYWQLAGHSERNRFVAFDRAYHGDTVGAASLGGVGAFFDRFSAIQFSPIRVGGLPELEAMTGEESSHVAAVVIEPCVQGTAGIRVWPEGMLAALRAWCDERGVLLILDEVFTGFGRTGRMFACEHEGVVPDFLCLAKGLTGGMMPLAATLTTERIYEAFLGEYEELKSFFYGHSYSANPLGCAAALASLEIFESERVLDSLEGKIHCLREGLADLAASPYVAETRQCGLIAGIALRRGPVAPCDWRDQTGARVCVAARKYGLLTRPILDVVTFIPPLCISASQIQASLGAIAKAIYEILEP